MNEIGPSKKKPKYGVVRHDTIVLGIDQSYERCGMSIAADGELLHVGSLDLSKLKTKTEKRRAVQEVIRTQAKRIVLRSADSICVLERIRTFSQSFISVPYIQSMGAMNALIVDTCDEFGIPVFSVNTKTWKSYVVGTSVPQDNDFGVPPEKWPTIQWVIEKGFEDSILRPVTGRKKKGTFIRGRKRWEYDNDAADSAGIAMFPFANNIDLEKMLKRES